MIDNFGEYSYILFKFIFEYKVLIMNQYIF